MANKPDQENASELLAEEGIFEKNKPQKKGLEERRCVLEGESALKKELIRLVMGPDGFLVVDVAGKLPGRGVWVGAQRALLEKALKKGQLAKAASRSLRQAVRPDQVPQDLVLQMERLLARRLADRLGLLNKAGAVITGFDKLAAYFAGLDKAGGSLDKIAGQPLQEKTADEERTAPLKQKANHKNPLGALVFVAKDAGADSLRKMRALVRDRIRIVQVFDREALSMALGKENAVHVLVFDKGGVDQLMIDVDRFAGLCEQEPVNDMEAVEADLPQVIEEDAEQKDMRAV